MRLRDTVRPPKRFEAEEEYFVPRSKRRRSTQGGSQNQPTCVEFNPDLPPAAFPTLDKPRVDGGTHGDGENKQDASSQITGSQQREGVLNKDNGNGKEKARIDLDEIPIDEIENRIASNDYLNPIYARNMALLATYPEVGRFRDMEDSDPDEVMTEAPAATGVAEVSRSLSGEGS